MKLSFFALALASSLLFASCSSEDTDNNESTEEETAETANINETQVDEANLTIIGTWQQTGLDVGHEEIPEEEREQNDKTIQETVDNTKYIFNDDGTFKVITWMLGSQVEYSGSYSAEGDILTMTESESQEETYFAYSLTATELILEQDDEGNILTFTFERE